MIDGGVFLGRNPANGNTLTPQALAADLKRRQIEKAVIASYKSIYFNYREGNAEVLAASKKFPSRFIPAAIINPFGYDPVKDLPYLRALKKAGFRVLGVYLSPAYYEISLESPLLREIVYQAAESGLVIQFGLRHAADLAKLSQMMPEIPGPVLVRWMCGRGYSALPEMIFAAQNHPNWFFDAGSLNSCGTIPLAVERLGADRLYFASNRPEAFADTSHFLLQASGISKEDLAVIYSGTLQKIFFNQKKRVFPPAVWGKKLKPWLEIPKIDTHWHPDGWNIIEPEKDFSQFEPQLRRFNLKKIVLSSIRALNGETVQGNRDLAKLIAGVERLYGLIVVDPLQIEMSLEEIARYGKHPKFVGIKTIQDLYGCNLDHPFYEKILEEAQARRLPVMAHIPGMLAAARKFSKATFVCAHSTYERVKTMFGQSNIVFDIATSHHDEAETKMASLIKAVGPERILFSSDGPLISPAWTLGKLAGIPLSGKDKERIFMQNALRVFPKLNGKTGKRP